MYEDEKPFLVQQYINHTYPLDRLRGTFPLEPPSTSAAQTLTVERDSRMKISSIHHTPALYIYTFMMIWAFRQYKEDIMRKLTWCG